MAGKRLGLDSAKTWWLLINGMVAGLKGLVAGRGKGTMFGLIWGTTTVFGADEEPPIMVEGSVVVWLALEVAAVGFIQVLAEVCAVAVEAVACWAGFGAIAGEGRVLQMELLRHRGGKGMQVSIRGFCTTGKRQISIGSIEYCKAKRALCVCVFFFCTNITGGRLSIPVKSTVCCFSSLLSSLCWREQDERGFVDFQRAGIILLL